jgi:hypothetical protein
MTRHAISPRLAIRTDLRGNEGLAFILPPS